MKVCLNSLMPNHLLLDDPFDMAALSDIIFKECQWNVIENVCKKFTYFFGNGLKLDFEYAVP